MSLQILADENIPVALKAFSRFGNVTLCHGRSIGPESAREADALIVRSITRVDASLLSGSRVRFVGTATIGTDHVDQDYLGRAGIHFADAAGCNANSVGEYVTAALLDLEASLGTSFVGKNLGVVGVGNVGTKVVEKGRALGLNLLLNDPPRMEREGMTGFVDLDLVLRESDVLTLHTPLVRDGRFPTHHLIGAPELDRMKSSAVLLNTSRGSVVDGAALQSALVKGRIVAAVLDVWEGEPKVDPNLLRRVKIATPHIAGYSLDGKLKGTLMMVEALARFKGEEGKVIYPSLEAPVENPDIHLIATGREAVREAVFSAYPIREDDQRMRELVEMEATERADAFDRLRKEYPVRREFQNYRVSGEFLDPETENVLRQIGFASLSKVPSRE